MNVKAVLCVMILSLSASPVFSSDAAVIDRTPQAGISVSTTAAMALDLFPGGGHFYTGHYVSGTVFGGAKIGFAGVSWLLYSYSQSAGRNYRTAKRTRVALGVSDSTPISGPDGRIRPVSSYRKDYDRRLHYFTLSLAANAALWTASWLVVWNYCEDQNRSAVPAFNTDLGMECTGRDQELVLRAGYSCPF